MGPLVNILRRIHGHKDAVAQRRRGQGKGRPMPQILSFGLPVLFGYLFQQLYNVVDSAIVGKTLGGAVDRVSARPMNTLSHTLPVTYRRSS